MTLWVYLSKYISSSLVKTDEKVVDLYSLCRKLTKLLEQNILIDNEIFESINLYHNNISLFYSPEVYSTSQFKILRMFTEDEIAVNESKVLLPNGSMHILRVMHLFNLRIDFTETLDNSKDALGYLIRRLDNDFRVLSGTIQEVYKCATEIAVLIASYIKIEVKCNDFLLDSFLRYYNPMQRQTIGLNLKNGCFITESLSLKPRLFEDWHAALVPLPEKIDQSTNETLHLYIRPFRAKPDTQLVMSVYVNHIQIFHYLNSIVQCDNISLEKDESYCLEHLLSW